jgi:hypothetical protein
MRSFVYAAEAVCELIPGKASDALLKEVEYTKHGPEPGTPPRTSEQAFRDFISAAKAVLVRARFHQHPMTDSTCLTCHRISKLKCELEYAVEVAFENHD